VPDSTHKPHRQLIRFVQDRPGHDRRYAIDARKLENELGWRAQETFATGLRKTVQWYLNNKAWMDEVTSSSYQEWVHANYGQRSEGRECGSSPGRCEQSPSRAEGRSMGIRRLDLKAPWNVQRA
jgi:hypothetical protein